MTLAPTLFTDTAGLFVAPAPEGFVTTTIGGQLVNVPATSITPTPTDTALMNQYRESLASAEAAVAGIRAQLANPLPGALPGYFTQRETQLANYLGNIEFYKRELARSGG